MSVEREKISLEFGIDEDFNTDSPELLNDVFGDIPAEGKVTKVTKTKPVQRKEEEDDEEEKKEKKKAPQPRFTQLDEDELLDTLENDEDTDEESTEPKEEEKEEEQSEDEATDETLEEEEEVAEINWEALSTDLFNIGIFELAEGEEQPTISTPEELKERFVLENKKNAGKMLENFVSSKGKDYEDAFQAIFIDGVNPREFYKGESQIQDLREMDITKEENQKFLLRKALTKQGFEEEDIQEEIERIEQYGELESTARRYHKVLVKDEEKEVESKRQAEISRQQRDKELKKEFQESIVSSLEDKIEAKDYDGIPVSKEFAQATYEFITNEKYQTPDGRRLTEWDKLYLDTKNPANHQKLIKLAMLAQLVEKDPTLTTIKRKVNTDKVNASFSTLTSVKGKKSPSAVKAPNSKKPFI